MSRNKLIDINDALFAELERLQDDDEFKNKDGTLDEKKLELAFKRADAVSGIAGKILETNRLQLDLIKTAEEYGYRVKTPENLLLEDKLEVRKAKV